MADLLLFSEKIMSISLPVETNRLYLSAINISDIDFLSRLWSNPVLRVHALLPSTYERAKTNAESWANKAKDHISETNNLVIKLKDAYQPVGNIIFTCSSNGEGMINQYSITPEYWGNGYATEAAMEAVKCLFEGLNAVEVVADCFPDNVRSMNVITKIGMHPRNAWTKNMHCITREEWLSIPNG